MTFHGAHFYDDAGVFAAYGRLRERADNANDTLEAPVMRQLLGDVAGQDFIDLGCGNAAFGRELLAAGAASYLGVDGSANMLAEAEKTLHGNGTAVRVQRADLQDWRGTPGSANRVCARLVLHYLADLQPLFEQIHQALRPGGLLVFSVEHPVLTAREHALENSPDSGPDGAWVVDDYFSTGQRVTDWMGARVVKYHRTVEDHFSALQACGFTVESLRESRPERAHFADEAVFARRQRVPLFLFMAARKS